jgi:hypothetical protein
MVMLSSPGTNGGLLMDRIRAFRPNAIVIFAFVSLVYIGSASYGGFQSKDTFTAAVVSWVLATHHTLNLSPLPQAHYDPPVLWVVRGAHGAIVSNRFPGAVLLALPLYAVVGGGYSAIPAAITTALCAAAVCVALYKVLLRLQPRHVALAGTAIFAFATSNWTVAAHELWEHTGAELFICLGMLAVLSRKWGLAGLAFGATVLFRAHLGVGAAVMCLGILWMERCWRPALTFACGVVPGVVAYLAWNWVSFGHFTVTGGYSDVVPGGVGPLGFLDNVGGTFVSPERGLLICTPVLLLAALGLPTAWRSSPKAVRVFAVAGLAYLVSQLWLIRFSGGNGFAGYRTCLETLVWCAPLLVSAGAVGFKRVPSAVVWTLLLFSVVFCTSAVFVPGDTRGVFNPWTSWAPVQLATQYGLGRVLEGALLGLAALLIVWFVMRSPADRHDSTGHLVKHPGVEPRQVRPPVSTRDGV